MANGLLAQLPDLGDLEQARAAIEGGLGDALGQLGSWGDPEAEGGPLRPLADALDQAGAAPDLAALLAPLDEAREQLRAAIPTDLDSALAAIEPLLDALTQLVDGSVLEPVLADLRAGRSVNEIARDALGAILQRVVGQLPGVGSGALGGEARAAIEALLAAAEGLDGSADPEAIARFVAERLLGAPLEPIGRIAALGDGLAREAAELLAPLGTVTAAEQALTAALAEAGTRLDGLDPASGPGWNQALAALREARDGLTGLRNAMQAIPAAVSSGLDALDPQQYRSELRGALRELAGATRGGTVALGRFATLEQLVQTQVAPLETLTAQLQALSPGQFSAQFRAQLDALGALLDALGEQVSDNPVMALFEDLREVMAAVADAIRSVRGTLEDGIAALLAAADAVAGQVAAVKVQVEEALRAIADALAAVDVAALAATLEGALDETTALLERIPAQELRDMLDAALTQVEALVEQLAEVAETVVGQAGPLVEALEAIDLEGLAEPVVGAILAVRDALEGLDLSFLPDSLRGELSAVVDPFFAEVRGSLDSIGAELTATFERAAGAVSELAGSIAERIGRFAEAIRELDPSALLQPLTESFQQLDDAVARLSGAALVAPLGEQIGRLRDGLAGADPSALLAPIELAFEEQLLAPVRALDPAALLQPLVEAFAPVEELIAKLDFSEAIGGLGQAASDLVGEAHAGLTDATQTGDLPGLGGMPAQVQPVIDLLRPGGSIEEWADRLNELLGGYRPAQIFAPLLEALQPLEEWLAAAPDGLLLEVFARLRSLLRGLETLAPDPAQLRAPLEQAAAAIEASRPSALLGALAAPYERLRAALAGIDRAALPASLQARYDEAAGLVAALDPAPAIGPLEAVFASLPGRLRALAAEPLGLEELRAEFGAALGVVAGLFPAALRAEPSPGAVSELLEAIGPRAQVNRLEAAFDAFLAAAERFGPAIQAAVEQFMGTLGERIASLSPAALFERFDELFAPVRDAVAEVSPRAIAEALADAYRQLTERLDALHPRAIREGAAALFDAALAKLDELRAAVVEAIAGAFDRALAKVRELLAALNPEALVVGLGNFFALIDERLGALGLEGLLERLAAAFERLGAQLGAVLERATGAVEQLVEATPV
jgi:hypothetical protein